MAIGPIEMSTIARSQDVIRYKIGDDTRALLQQANLGEEKKREIRTNSRKVCKRDEAGWHDEKFDASAGGRGTYGGDGGKGRKKTQEDKRGLRESGGFDVQI